MTQSEAKDILNNDSAYMPSDLSINRDNWPINPKINLSIIIPCYKVERYIDRCIKSVLSQRTKYSFEVIVIDDGSPDRCGEIIDNYAKDDSRVRPIHQLNGGFARARNVGIEHAQGECIMFVDSDDELEPDAIEVFLNVYYQNDCNLVTSNYSEITEKDKYKRIMNTKRNHGAPWGRVYSRELWRNVCFPQDLWFEDTVNAYCIFPIAKEIYIEKNLYRYRIRNTSISKTSKYSKKCVDTYWVVEQLLYWCCLLNIDINYYIYSQTIKQFGPLAFNRVSALSLEELHAFFVCCSSLVNSKYFKLCKKNKMTGPWLDIEESLLNEDFVLWIVACCAAS